MCGCPGTVQLFKELKIAAQSGSLVALTGIVGCGKTTTLCHLFTVLAKENKILVSKSLSVDKNRATLATLIAALFYDLATDDKEVKIPALGEKRERELRDLIKKGKKPVVLFVDEAHDLHPSTLTGLKRLIEVIDDGGGTLTVLLAGHPKLKNDLRRPTMEEIGYRSVVFTLEGMVEPKLTRNGYDVRGLAEQFHAKPAEIKLLFRGQLDPTRTKELTQYGSVNRFDRSDRPLNPPILGDFYRSCSPRIGGWGAYPNRIGS